MEMIDREADGSDSLEVRTSSSTRAMAVLPCDPWRSADTTECHLAGLRDLC
jgi:hypothetical protein